MIFWRALCIFVVMRLSAFILNLLMAIMVLVPCRDHKALGMSKARVQQVDAATPGGGQADDDCSPLCTCSCCASVSSVVELATIVDVAPVVISKKFPLYITPEYGADRSAVWQPPRIG
jgi:hypothetical protein